MKNVLLMSTFPSFNTPPEPGGGGGPAAPAAPPSPAPDANPSGGAPAAAAPPPTGAPSSPHGQPSPEPEYEIKVGGKTLKLPLSKLLERAQQGEDYTQKTQALSEQQKQWLAQQESWKKQEQDRIIKEIKEQERLQREAAETDPAQRALNEIERFKQQQADERLQAVIDSVKQKFPDVDEHLLVVKANQKGITDLKDLFGIAEELDKGSKESLEKQLDGIFSNAEHPRVKALIDKAVKDYLAKKQVPNAPKHINGGSGAAPGGEAAPKKLRDFNDADEKSLADLA